MAIAQCEFCKSELKDVPAHECEVCGFPVKGTEQEQQDFMMVNAELKSLIDESETALSWARFVMLWPWVGAFIMGSFYFLRPPIQWIAFFASLTICTVFIAAFFAVKKKPVEVLTSVFTVYVMTLIIGLFEARDLISFNTKFLSTMIIPVIMFIMLGNALYLERKVQKAFRERKYGKHES
ncbi:MAG TPA: hypothetical protein VL651_14120 [Bacteroidia bacterium]|jgi:hypothetical protein|nr:hypothetical protein [Bacteroidia bacterium]